MFELISFHEGRLRELVPEVEKICADLRGGGSCNDAMPRLLRLATETVSGMGIEEFAERFREIHKGLSRLVGEILQSVSIGRELRYSGIARIVYYIYVCRQDLREFMILPSHASLENQLEMAKSYLEFVYGPPLPADHMLFLNHAAGLDATESDPEYAALMKVRNSALKNAGCVRICVRGEC